MFLISGKDRTSIGGIPGIFLVKKEEQRDITIFIFSAASSGFPGPNSLALFE
jgi:hypothetical protein